MKKKSLSKDVQLIKKVKFQELLLFTKHMSVMIKAGISISEAVETLKNQAKSPYFKSILSKIQTDIENGQSLTTALKHHPKVFDQFYVSVVEISEESGTLEENLEFLANQLNKDYAVRKKIKGALLYPSIVILAMTVMGGFIIFFILPQLVEFFATFDTELPLPTKILLFIGNAAKNYGFFIVIGLVVWVLATRFLISLPAIKPKWHAFSLKLPIIGKLRLSDQLARFARNFGLLLKSGVPISTALETTANTLSNLKFRDDLIKINKQATRGEDMAAILTSGEYKEFPPIVIKMIEVGEKTGNLEESLLYLSDFFENEIDEASKNLTVVLEPILLLFIGIAVGFVALAIISPIYEITGSIRR